MNKSGNIMSGDEDNVNGGLNSVNEDEYIVNRGKKNFNIFILILLYISNKK